MKAKSIRGRTTEEISSALKAAVTHDFNPTLAIVFVSTKQDRGAIRRIFNDSGIAIFGATTNGNFIDDKIELEGASILLLEINPSYFSILIEEYPNKNYREVAAGIAEKTFERFGNPAFLIAGSHIETDAEQLLSGFADVAGNNVNIHGCMAGDDFAFTQQFAVDSHHGGSLQKRVDAFIFNNYEESDRGVVILAFDQEKIEMKGCATCGWHPVGTVKTVTKSIGNHVFTVDDMPVLDLTVKYGGLDVSPEKGAFSVEVAEFPLQLQRETGDPVMRVALHVDWSDHSFYCSGNVPQGAKVRFSLPPDFDVVQKVIQASQDLKTSEMPEADALIVFSCAGRFTALGPLAGDEIEGIRGVWNVPMTGMFSNAELARATGGELEMHNLTACVVALREK